MITYQIESIKDCIEEIKELFLIHYDEVEKDKSIVDFNPDIDLLIKTEDLGILDLFTARDDQALIGYYLSMTTPSLNNKDVIQSTESGLFVSKEYRSSVVGLKLVRFVEKSLVELGVNVMFASTKVDHPCDPLFIRVGMKLNERQFIKHIGK